MPAIIAVQMDHPSRLNTPLDTTVMLIEEAQRRGATVYFYEPASLSWQSGALLVKAAAITVAAGASLAVTLGEPRTLDLTTASAVLMRQDPPFDMTYITYTHLLEQLPASVRVLNDPAGVRNAPEKLSALALAPLMPPTLISRDPEAIRDFAAAQGHIVCKPLYGFGGGGVYRFDAQDGNLETLLEWWLSYSREPLMWQAFVPQVAQLDTRVILIDGEICSSFRRIPPPQSIRANMRVGGQAVAGELTPRQREICDAVRPMLREQGLYLTGLDLIGDYLTEINVTSPTGLRAAQRLYGVNLAATFWDQLALL